MDELAKKCGFRIAKITKITLIILIILINLLFSILLVTKNVTLANASNSANIVIEQSSGRILSGDNYDIPLPIASTTKILTALTVIDNVDNLDAKVKIPKEAVGIEGSSIYLVEGEELTYTELLYGLMLRSGNDSAIALAIATSGSVEKFVIKMNEKAKECKVSDKSFFVNPHGLHDEKHLCTARDLAKISAEAMKRDIFKQIVSTKNVTISGEPKRYLANKNKMLAYFDGANGIKTGFTKKSGRCLVSSAERNGMQLIAVVLNHGDMWNDSISMLNDAFEEYSQYCILDGKPILIDVVKGKYKKAYVSSPYFSYPLTNEEYDKIKVDFSLQPINAPKKAGECVGEVFVYLDNRLLFSDKLFTINNINKKGFFYAD